MAEVGLIVEKPLHHSGAVKSIDFAELPVERFSPHKGGE